jgi:hypothetical protein
VLLFFVGSDYIFDGAAIASLVGAGLVEVAIEAVFGRGTA